MLRESNRRGVAYSEIPDLNLLQSTCKNYIILPLSIKEKEMLAVESPEWWILRPKINIANLHT